MLAFVFLRVPAADPKLELVQKAMPLLPGHRMGPQIRRSLGIVEGVEVDLVPRQRVAAAERSLAGPANELAPPAPLVTLRLGGGVPGLSWPGAAMAKGDH